jgi:hypothetical protein
VKINDVPSAGLNAPRSRRIDEAHGRTSRLEASKDYLDATCDPALRQGSLDRHGCASLVAPTSPEFMVRWAVWKTATHLTSWCAPTATWNV